MKKILQLQQECFLLLLQTSVKTIPFNILLSAIICCYLLYRGAELPSTIVWFLAMTFLSLIRLFHSHYTLIKRLYIDSAKAHLALFVGLTFLTGCLWGFCYVWFYKYFLAMHQNVITVVLGGLAAGGLASLSVYRPAYYAFLFPIFLPMIIYNLSFGILDKDLLAVTFLLFIIMLMVTANFTSRVLHKTINLSKEKDCLISNLHQANHEKDDALDEIRRISITDSLTGLYNRRYFDLRLDEELRRAERNKHFLVLLFIDVDNFKWINDNLGHPKGDEFLKRVATVIANNTSRSNDSSFRIGGDEFAIILANCRLEEANLIAKTIQEEIKIDSPNKVSLSMGIVETRPSKTKLEDLVSAADFMLYQAKKNGKNIIYSSQT